MQTKYKIAAGSLAGAVAIHVAFVACSGGQGGPGVSDGGLLDAMFDALANAIDGTTRDAIADTDGGAAGCTCPPQGPMQTVPASENPSQLERGNTPLIETIPQVVVKGPFVLTDSAVPNTFSGGADLYIVPSAATCPGAPDGGVVDSSYLGRISYVSALQQGSTTPAALLAESIHGGRYVVPAGQMLCAVQVGVAFSLQWAGFRPY